MRFGWRSRHTFGLAAIRFVKWKTIGDGAISLWFNGNNTHPQINLIKML